MMRCVLLAGMKLESRDISKTFIQLAHSNTIQQFFQSCCVGGCDSRSAACLGEREPQAVSPAPPLHWIVRQCTIQYPKLDSPSIGRSGLVKLSTSQPAEPSSPLTTGHSPVHEIPVRVPVSLHNLLPKLHFLYLPSLPKDIRLSALLSNLISSSSCVEDFTVAISTLRTTSCEDNACSRDIPVVIHRLRLQFLYPRLQPPTIPQLHRK
ncbi:uncharacterized protein LY89DRAFT_187866 [Mollisia scopiformis]|uniref:Uncharacterized protein n=1 Tax=Mollisia scopiformis TaxID=149040 RepID=A0A194XTS9_MOLSC|nr:uncharacterized protein LY89DRAFT_187866 [Mollisia scopiformis]KUJ23618.1 hypothetical protein LY89DRAFT_187866 [Mollisia scopiformis]